jgi:hypothetical protein
MKLVDEANDARLLMMAEKRLKKADMDKTIPVGKVFEDLGIKEEDLDDGDEVDLE